MLLNFVAALILKFNVESNEDYCKIRQWMQAISKPAEWPIMALGQDTNARVV